MALATLTHIGRAAIALAISKRPLHLAWGSGDPAWDNPDATLPSLIDSTRLATDGQPTPFLYVQVHYNYADASNVAMW